MNLRKLLYSIGVPVLLLLSLAGAAQTKITGRVTDSTGKGIPGVSVSVKGQASRGTSTAADGTYTLTVPASSTTLVFSSVGYAYREVSLSNANNVTLQTTSGSLNEVVVIGYGTVRKKDLTGSITNITAKDFQKGVITTPEQLIAGKVAGVSIISNGGQPGQGSTIRIRGGSSLNASNDPLIVVDGVPLSNDKIPGASNGLSLINPNDIESFTILKDASAAAIYGTRAANGVILITTKKGSSSKVRVNFSSVNSISKITKEVDVLSADQVRDIVNKLGNAQQKSQLGNANTNWQDQIYRTAFASDNNVSLSGGVKWLPYRLSLGYLTQDGVLKTDHIDRASVGLSLNPTFFDNHLKVDVSLHGSDQKSRFGNQGAIGTAVYFDPTQPVYSNSKRFGGYFEWIDPTTGNPSLNAARNPLAQLYDKHDNGDAQRSVGNIQLDYKVHFLPDLHVNVNLGYDVSKGSGTIFVSDSSSLEFNSHGENNRYKEVRKNTLAEVYLSYNKDLKSIKSHIDVQAGHSYNDYLTTLYGYAKYYANGTKVPNSDPPYAIDHPRYTLESYFGRLNYTFNDKYLLTATFRRDGSSKFGPLNHWGNFPALAFAWRIKDEGFLRTSKTVSDLKLRLGYGITGQQDGLDYFEYLAFYSLSYPNASYPMGNNYYQMYRPSGYNTGIKWEQTATYNAGLDYGFANNRVTGTVDVYYKKTSDLMNTIPQAAGTNFSAYLTANVGDMTNKGVEFNITVQPIRNKTTTWDVSFNATYNKNEITNLTVVPQDPHYLGFQGGSITGSQGFAFLNAVGGPKNTFYLYHQVYDQNGKPIEGLFEDVNRDGIINEQDKYKGKQADPNLFFGFSTNLTHGRWNAGFVLRANFNNYVYNNIYSNNGRLNQILGAVTTGNASANYLETNFGGNTDQQLLSDYYLQNASFLRMDNANIGYNFGNVLRNANLRAMINVQNVFVITKYTGLDPEIGNGIDNNLYPRPRIYSLGLNLSF